MSQKEIILADIIVDGTYMPCIYARGLINLLSLRHSQKPPPGHYNHTDMIERQEEELKMDKAKK